MENWKTVYISKSINDSAIVFHKKYKNDAKLLHIPAWTQQLVNLGGKEVYELELPF